jgi:hypothetical protein
VRARRTGGLTPRRSPWRSTTNHVYSSAREFAGLEGNSESSLDSGKERKGRD